jgi:peptidoglycan/LPS O-acetylase OafA/YrhL
MKRYYPLTQLLAVAGAFVVVTTFAFSSSVATSIDFAVGIGVTIAGLAIAAIAPSERRRAHVGLGLGSAVVGAWTILVTLGIFSGSTQRWLDFAAGAAVAAAGLAAGALVERSQRRALQAADTPAPVSSNGFRVAEQDRIVHA